MFAVYVVKGSDLHLLKTFFDFGEAYRFMNRPEYKNIQLLLKRFI